MAEETALMMSERSQHERRSWAWLFDRLRDYVELRGERPEDDERLSKLYEDTYFRAEFIVDPVGDIGPVADIMAAFRENEELWLAACPAGEHVVVLPRQLVERIVAALPVADNALGAFKLEYVEDAGRTILRSGATSKRMAREHQELSEGEKIRVKMHRWLDEYAKGQGPLKAPSDGDSNG